MAGLPVTLTSIKRCIGTNSIWGRCSAAVCIIASNWWLVKQSNWRSIFVSDLDLKLSQLQLKRLGYLKMLKIYIGYLQQPLHQIYQLPDQLLCVDADQYQAHYDPTPSVWDTDVSPNNPRCLLGEFWSLMLCFDGDWGDINETFSDLSVCRNLLDKYHN